MLLGAGAPLGPSASSQTGCLHSVAGVSSWRYTQLGDLWQGLSGGKVRLRAGPTGPQEGPAEGLPPEALAVFGKALGEWLASSDHPVDYSGCALALLDQGLAVDLTDRRGATPLQLACWAGNMDAVRFFLDHGAKVGCRDQDGYSALEFAAEQGHAEAARWLIQAGADAEATDMGGRTAAASRRRATPGSPWRRPPRSAVVGRRRHGTSGCRGTRGAGPANGPVRLGWPPGYLRRRSGCSS